MNLLNKLLWLAFFASAAAAADLQNRPPVIISISTGIGDPSAAAYELEVLEKPEDFIVRGDASDTASRKNRLICKADNADRLLWQYRNTTDAAWGSLVDPMVAGSPEQDGQELSLEVNDGSATEIKDLLKLNGYYRCVAQLTSKGYQTQSPPVRIVIPSVEAGSVPSTILTEGLPIANKPYSLPCKSGETRLVPKDAADFVPVKYKWELKVGLDVHAYPDDDVNYNNRVKVDPKTGSLNFAFVKSSDSLDKNDPLGEPRLRCFVDVGDSQGGVEMGDYAGLQVTANDDPVEDVGVLYPETEMQDGVLTVKPEFYPSCIANTECSIIILFSGLYAANGTVYGKAPDGEEYLGEEYPGFKFQAKATNDPLTNYTATLRDKTTKEIRLSVRVPVVVKVYPKMSATANFPPVQYVTTGSNVELVCDADNADEDRTQFFINGAVVATGSPPYVTRKVGKSLQVDNIGRDNSFSVQCVAANKVGELYVNSIVNVYDEPMLKNDPVKGHFIQNKNYSTEYNFTCSTTIDPKMVWNDFYFMTNRTDLVNKKVGDNYEGIESVGSSQENATFKLIALVVALNPDTQNLLSYTDWWCVFKYRVLDDPQEREILTSRMEVRFEKAPSTNSPQKEPFKYYPLIFGAIGGLIFLILIIVLINCYVQKNKGEQYYVDEKERKAGHNPAEEMEAYGFSDYTRPDQNPIKGSRASMNISDKPMESDTGSLDEYGVDMDPSRYNEDGSFIGQYSQNGPPSRNQADV